MMMSDALLLSIQELGLHPRIVEWLRFDRRSDQPLVLTDEMREMIENDTHELETYGVVMDYETQGDLEVFDAYQSRRIFPNSSVLLQNEHEFRDSNLVNALAELAIDVDFETFAALRGGVRGGGVYTGADDDCDSVDSLGDDIPLQYRYTKANEDDDTCYVCLNNVPNAVFTNCGHAGICCPCAHKIVTGALRTCPLCRVEVTSFDQCE